MKIIKIITIVLISTQISLGLLIPLSQNPSNFWQFPIVTGLEEKIRNIIFHVPTAWVTMIAFLVSLFYAVLYLTKNKIEYDIKSTVSAEIGLLFCILATVTGSIWAKFNWGSFWNWDPRETSIFILLLIYTAYFALRSAISDKIKKARLSSVYAILAGLTTPFFIFILPRLAGGLHPGSKGDVEGSGPIVEFKMPANMLLIFFIGLIGFTLLYFWMLNLRTRLMLLENKFNLMED